MSGSTENTQTCVECGPGGVPHRLTYVAIVIDEILAGLLGPGNMGRYIDRQVQKIESRVTPHILSFLMDRGLAKRVAAPDDDTQLLALMLWNEANERGITVEEVRLFNLPRNIFVAQYQGGKKIAYEGIPVPPGKPHVHWMDNKAVLKEQFRTLGLPVARGGAAGTWSEAKALYDTLTPPAIVKPYSGSASRHTTLHIDSRAELERAFGVAKQVAPRAVIEEELLGPVYRATVVDGVFRAALRRDQPHVIGDGVHSVTELVALENTHPARGGPYFSKMQLDEAALIELAWQQLTPQSVPALGRRVTLHQKVNWSVGGTTCDVTDETHPDNIELFEEAARVLRAPIAGIDFVISDISRSWKTEERCGILECNSMPFFDNHHLPFEGKPRNIARHIWDMVGAPG